MWLITVHNWWAALDKYDKAYNVTERVECWVTRDELNSGLYLLRRYVENFQRRYRRPGGSTLELRIQGIQHLPTETDIEYLAELGVREITSAVVQSVLED